MTQLQGPGPPPEASRSRLSPPRRCATARCSFSSGTSTVPAVQRCTTRPVGPGPPPVRWIRVPWNLTSSRCSGTAGSCWPAATAPRCTTRPAGPGPPPVLVRASFVDTFTVLRDGRVLVTGGDAPRCTTRPVGPGPPPGRGTARALVQRPSCCPTARSSLRAATRLRRRLPRSGHGRGIRPRHGVLDRDREHAREGQSQGGLPAARWQGAGGRIPR